MADAHDTYGHLNAACTRRLVFRIGHDAGFYSEYNNMVLAILYCLRHCIRFEMFSAESPLLGPTGWTTFFRSFCVESPDTRHRVYNYRHPRSCLSIVLQPGYRLARWRFKMASAVDFLTADVWRQARAQRLDPSPIALPALGIDGTLRDACRAIVHLTYRLNDETRSAVEHLAARLQLPPRYAGLHIRGGDKRRQSPVHHPDEYMTRLRAVSTLRDVFVLTDDHHAFTHLVRSHPEYTFRTLCSPPESGYDHGRFLGDSEENKRRQMLNLLTSIEVLRQAEEFVGTFSANPGAFLGMAMPPDRVHGLDRTAWLIH
jgi:hypothetical protein